MAKYFYLSMFILSIINFFLKNNILIIFLILVALFCQTREAFFGEKNEYNKQENYNTIKIIIKIFLFMISIIVLIVMGISFNIDTQKYINWIYILYFIFFFIFCKFFYTQTNFINKFIKFIFELLDNNLIYWNIVTSFFISINNVYLYQDLIVNLLTIFTFLPPLISLLDKEQIYQNKIIRYTIFLIINLLLVLILEKLNIPNFTFKLEKNGLIIVLLSLTKLLCTSFSYFYMLQITYLSCRITMIPLKKQKKL